MIAVRDASDRLSPIVVKELRQGVRSHLFTGAFLLQQLLLVLTVTYSALVEAPPHLYQEFSVLFWMVVGVPMLLVLPMGAGLSLSGEMSAHTLEPVLLTRLTPWRVVAGKWTATAAQTLVLTVSVSPFVMVRYYLGAVEVARDLSFLVGLLACSFLLAALGIAVAAAPLSALFRWVLVAAVAVPLTISFLTAVGTSIFSPILPPEGLVILGACAIPALMLLAGLEVGAFLLAPTALVRPARLRVLALLALGIGGWLATQPSATCSAVASVWSVALVALVAVGAVCERTPLVPTRYAWFFKRRATRALAFLFAPGWPAGVAFALLLATIGAVAAVAAGRAEAAAFTFGGIAGTLLLPVLVARTFFPRARPFLILLLTTLVTWSLSVVAPLALFLGSEPLWLVGCVLLPLCPSAYSLARLKLLGDYGMNSATEIPPFADVLYVAVLALAVVLALRHTVREWRTIRGLFVPPAVPPTGS